MNKNSIKFSSVALAVAACLSSNVWAADTATDAPDVTQLREQLNQLNQRYEAQSSALKALARRLQQLEASGQGQARPIHAVDKKVVAADGGDAQPTNGENQPGQENQPAQQNQTAQGDNEPVVKEAPQSRSAEAVYQEQNALFNQTFTLEAGISYSHSDRRQLTLDGFLALDAIFLGNVNLDRIKSDIVQLDVTGRWGATDRLQFDFNAPFLYRYSTFESGGVGGSSTTLSDETVTNSNIGDVSLGAYYRLFPETQATPDVVWNVRVKAPTGKDPYGIKFRTQPDNNNLSVPDDVPTGNGVWALSTGLTFVKTVDPAILFANIAYTHNFTHKFGDISSDPDIHSSAKVDLGDAYQLGGGVAFALSDRMSLSTSYAHRFNQKARVKKTGEGWDDVTGSQASAGSLNFGVTYAMTDKLSMVSNVAIGVTPDAPDVTVGVKFPYNF